MLYVLWFFGLRDRGGIFNYMKLAAILPFRPFKITRSGNNFPEFGGENNSLMAIFDVH